jgi:hypothetical protein
MNPWVIIDGSLINNVPQIVDSACAQTIEEYMISTRPAAVVFVHRSECPETESAGKPVKVPFGEMELG